MTTRFPNTMEVRSSNVQDIFNWLKKMKAGRLHWNALRITSTKGVHEWSEDQVRCAPYTQLLDWARKASGNWS